MDKIKSIKNLSTKTITPLRASSLSDLPKHEAQKVEISYEPLTIADLRSQPPNESRLARTADVIKEQANFASLLSGQSENVCASEAPTTWTQATSYWNIPEKYRKAGQDPATYPAYQSLTPEKQQAFTKLFRDSASISQAQSALLKILDEGKLSDIDHTGFTLLYDLYQLKTQKFVDGVDGNEIFRGALLNIADPGGIWQGLRGTCVVTTVEYINAKCYPAEYIRLLADLLQPDGKCSLEFGNDYLNINNGSIPPDDSLRSHVDRIYQSTMMEYANGSDKIYDNTKDKHIGKNSEEYNAGLNPSKSDSELIKLMNSIMPYDSTDVKFENSSLKKEDILDWQAFLLSLKQNRDPVKEQIFQSLSSQGKKIINKWEPGKEISDEKKESIINALNSILNSTEFCKSRAFANLEINEEGRKLMQRGIENLNPKEIKKLNFIRLEYIYPTIIKSLNSKTTEEMQKILDRGYLIPATLYWSVDDTIKMVDSHEILVEKIEGEDVYIRNPQSNADTGAKEDNHPDRQIISPGGHLKMTNTVFFERLSQYIAPKYGKNSYNPNPKSEKVEKEFWEANF